MKTQAQKSKSTSQRLLKTYGITLAERDAMETKCGNCCEVCGNPPVNRPLHIDHDHKWRYIKVAVEKEGTGWKGVATYLGKEFAAFGTRRNPVIQHIRKMLQKASVRGLICWADNKLLREARDNPENLRAAARYLERHQEGK